MPHPKVNVKICFLDSRAEQYLPKYQSELASGFDLHSLEDVELIPQSTVLIKTGISAQIPPGYEIQVRPRSGMSLKTPFRVANSPGTCDADYLGDISVIGYNTACYGGQTVNIKAGDRIAQCVIVPVVQGNFSYVKKLDPTERGSNGFGSTGK
jgi:dUTP pyrophosphatase